MIKNIGPSFVHQIWAKVEPYLKDSLEEGKGPVDYNLPQLQMFLTNGGWLLFVSEDDTGNIQGAATVSLVNYPLSRVAFVTATGGRFIVNQQTLDQFKRALSTVYGATKIQAFVRPSMERILNGLGFSSGNKLVEICI